MEVICLQDQALYKLVDKVIDHITRQRGIEHEPWITPEEAMKILNIKSKTTLQKLRDEREIVFSQPDKRIILYKHESLLAYLERHSKH